MNARAIFASKVNTLKGTLSFRDLSSAILEKTGCYISHSTLYQYSLPGGKSPSPDNLDILARYAEKPASWFFDDPRALPSDPLPDSGQGVLARHFMDELSGMYERLHELEKLRTEADYMKSLDVDQRARMVDFLNARTAPMISTERKTIESYLHSWPEIIELLGPLSAEANRLLTCIIQEFFPSLAHLLKNRDEGQDLPE